MACNPLPDVGEEASISTAFQEQHSALCCSQLESVLAYWGFGLYWGKAVSQNAKGHILGHVKVRIPQELLRLLSYCDKPNLMLSLYADHGTDLAKPLQGSLQTLSPYVVVVCRTLGTTHGCRTPACMPPASGSRSTRTRLMLLVHLKYTSGLFCSGVVEQAVKLCTTTATEQQAGSHLQCIGLS